MSTPRLKRKRTSWTVKDIKSEKKDDVISNDRSNFERINDVIFKQPSDENDIQTSKLCPLDSTEDLGKNYSTFIQQVSSVEKGEKSGGESGKTGNRRFLHHSDQLDLKSVALSSLFSSFNEDISSKKSVNPVMDHLFNSLSNDKASKKLKKRVNEVRNVNDDDIDVNGIKSEEKKRSLESVVDEDILRTPSSDLDKLKAERVTVYDQTREDISVWDGVVHSRRSSSHLKFPLKREGEGLKLFNAKECSANFQACNSLEERIMSLLNDEKGGKSVEKDDTSSILSSMTLRQAVERKKEISRLKAMQSNRELKIRRQNKIKSRKYRRLVRKEKERESERELKTLEKVDPELALQRMEKDRMFERATLRHRNTSRFMQLQAKRSKLSKESQERVKEQLDKHRVLIAKPNIAEDSSIMEGKNDDFGELKDLNNEHIFKQLQDVDVSNPWFNLKSQHKSTVNDLSQGKDGETDEQYPQDIGKLCHEDIEATNEEEEDDDNMSNIMIRDRLHANSNNIDTLFDEAENILMAKGFEETTHRMKLRKEKKSQVKVKSKTESSMMKDDAETGEIHGSLPFTVNDDDAENVDFSPLKSILRSKSIVAQNNFRKIELNQMKNNVKNDEKDINNQSLNEKQRSLVAEAFAGDDVVSDFRMAKEDDIKEKNKKKYAGEGDNGALAGWGSWSGPGSQSARKRIKISSLNNEKLKKKKTRNFENSNVILNDDKDKQIVKHQVKAVPFPYQSVSDFQSSLRMPIGDTFIPRTAFNKLTKPEVETKAGEMIEPMDKYELVKRSIILV